MSVVMNQVLHNRYRVDATIGCGGMGAVYRAWDLILNIPVVVKENLIHSQEAQRQFEREAKILAALRHPNLPRVTDHFFVPGQGQYLVMDYVEGEDLEKILNQRGALPESQVLIWIYEVLTALEYLHGQNIIHRDIKPANIRITSRGQVFLVDFGLAKVRTPLQSTTTGARGVTPGYAPPEQYGQGRTDARSDLYSVGATLYALLTGQKPPDGIALMVGDATLIPPRQVNRNISPRTEVAVRKAMQARPGDRPQTVAEFRALLPSPSVSHVSTSKRSATRKSSVHRSGQVWLWSAVALVLVLSLMGLLAAVVAKESRQSQITTTALSLATDVVETVTDPAPVPSATDGAQAGLLTGTAQALEEIATARTKATDEAWKSGETATAQAEATNAAKQAAWAAATAAMEATATARTKATDTAMQAAWATATAAMEATVAAQPVVQLVEVYATRKWQSTGIQTRYGDRVVIEYVSGTWTYWSGTVAPHDGGGPRAGYVCAEHMRADSCVEPVPDFATGALVGRVGQQLLRVGNRLTFTSETAGPLDLRINDGDGGLHDNDGSIIVRISVQHP